jgi:hypothetical protein
MRQPTSISARVDEEYVEELRERAIELLATN